MIGSFFFTCTLLYTLYMLVMVSQSHQYAIILFLILLIQVLYFGVICNKPERSLYCFVFIYFFFPTGGNNFAGILIIEELPGMSLQVILLTAAACCTALQIVRNKRTFAQLPSRLRKFCILITITFIASFFVLLIKQIGKGSLGLNIGPEALVWNAPLLIGIIFLSGCVFFLRKVGQIEKVFVFIVAAGMELLLEVILFSYLRLPLPLANRAIHPSGRFQSFIFADVWMVGAVCIASIVCIMYFVLSRKRYSFFLLVPLQMLPIIAGYERSPMASCIVAILTFAFLYQVKLRNRVGFWVMVASISLLGYSISSRPGYMEDVMDFFRGDIRKDYFESYMKSWRSRFGSYMRGLDAFVYTLPFGTGPNEDLLYPVMASKNTPQYFSEYVGIGSDEEAIKFYWSISTGQHLTGSHNFFINFIAYYGILGLFSAIYFIAGFYNQFKEWLRFNSGQDRERFRLDLMQRAGFTLILSFSFFFLFTQVEFIPLLFFSYFLIFLSSKRKMVSNHGVHLVL